MTITTQFLIEAAKAINGESALQPSYTAYGQATGVTINISDLALSDEIGTRDVASTARTNNQLSFSSTRSGATVIDTANGDIIGSIGVHGTVSGNDLLWGVPVSGVIQTTDFDIETVWTLTVGRQ